ncbi:DUF397 domain-containing protein [Streptomyces katrae]|uniref:DUF397 domain-containing protein n=1 Tax=Streptomyces katrae TaxID=68223 RepID=A0ABT7GSR3_9ACTN|nr:DUF397 domain-containing protein [Streptomyces katrae]MDK9496652.1 DUF397 domain-containing protein [Streptomyces katrae]
MSTSTSWQKSSFSGGNGENCIEVGQQAGSIVMRESDDPGHVITTSRSKLAAFIQGVKAGEFDHFVS